jgi:hypothetical protein
MLAGLYQSAPGGRGLRRAGMFGYNIDGELNDLPYNLRHFYVFTVIR